MADLDREFDLSLTVNGELRSFQGPLTVAGLLEELAIETKAVAVERNRVIVTKDRMAELELTSGDVLEIVTFVGGG